MANKEYFRPYFPPLLKRLKEDRQFLQVLVGPRQVGKTTLILQVAKELGFPVQYASADEPGLQSPTWIGQQWELARNLSKRNGKALLILDEVQKLTEWSSVVKQLWDEDTKNKLNIIVVLLGSSQLLLQSGLSESLAGRFERMYIPHWSFTEMKEAFGYSLEEYIYFGGYPGASRLIRDEDRWSRYIKDSLVETTISRDVLLMSRIAKPVLLRRLFELGCHYSGQILSYQKMMGQLQDVGNTTTLSHYLQLLDAAGLLTGIEKFSIQTVRVKGSSPKLQVLDSALLSVQLRENFEEAQKERDLWGRCVESSIGAHLSNQIRGTRANLYYWREGKYEVDFVLEDRGAVFCLEVKSGAKRTSLPGIHKFLEQYPKAKPLLVGAQGISLETFLSTPLSQWLI